MCRIDGLRNIRRTCRKAQGGNDTVAIQLNHLIEATCTRGVKLTASTLFVVEGTLGDQGGSGWRDSGWLGRLLCPLPGTYFVLRAYRVGSALLSLRSTLRLYGEFREVPRVLLQSQCEGGTITRVVEASVVFLFCVAHLFWLVRRQRRPPLQKGQGQEAGSRRRVSTAGTAEAGLAFCDIRNVCICPLSELSCCRHSRPAGGWLMLVFAILGMDAILTDSKLDHVTRTR